MCPDFVIERYIGYARGVAGGNIWLFCTNKEALKEAGAKALDAIHHIDGVVTTFDICSAGSKPETHFPEIGPTTNHSYCPSLKGKLGKESKVPEGVAYIAEVVYNAVSIDAIKKATKAGVEATVDIPGVVRISAGNYEGKLGQYKIPFSEIF